MSYVSVGACFDPEALGPDAELLDKIVDLFDLTIGQPGYICDYGVTLTTGDATFEIELPGETNESAARAVTCLQGAVRTVAPGIAMFDWRTLGYDEDAWEPGSKPPRPRGTVPCEWCSFWHMPGEEPCADGPVREGS